MTAQAVVSADEAFDWLADVALKAAPFQGAAIALFDSSSRVFKGAGGAGIFVGDKVRAHLEYGQERDGAGPPLTLDVAARKLARPQDPVAQNGGPGEIVALSQPGGSVPAFWLDDASGREQRGAIRLIREIYADGRPPNEVFAFSLVHPARPQPEIIGHLIFNNVRPGASFAPWIRDRASAVGMRVLLRTISSVASEHYDDPTAFGAYVASGQHVIPLPFRAWGTDWSPDANSTLPLSAAQHVATVCLTRRHIRRYVAWPVTVSSAGLALTGLTLLSGTALGFAAAFSGAILSYEGYVLLRNCGQNREGDL